MRECGTKPCWRSSTTSRNSPPRSRGYPTKPGEGGSNPSASTHERHLRCHYRQEQNIGVERQACHVEDRSSHLPDVHPGLWLDRAVRLHDPLRHSVRHLGGSIANV